MVLADKNDKRTIVNMFKYLKENVTIKKRKREDIFKNTKCTFLGLKNTISEIRILLGGLNSRLDTTKEKNQ